jgi:hypothetical protein
MEESNEKEEEEEKTKHSLPLRIIPDHLLSDPLFSSLSVAPPPISTPLAIGLTCCYPSTAFL